MANNRMKNNLKALAIYSLICYIILIPIKMWIIAIPISILVGFLFGLLNDIIIQLRKLNGEKFDEIE
jgi:ribose/xylose/arabinose/galactoside ABC-type transport system permease subunit